MMRCSVVLCGHGYCSLTERRLVPNFSHFFYELLHMYFKPLLIYVFFITIILLKLEKFTYIMNYRLPTTVNGASAKKHFMCGWRRQLYTNNANESMNWLIKDNCPRNTFGFINQAKAVLGEQLAKFTLVIQWEGSHCLINMYR